MPTLDWIGKQAVIEHTRRLRSRTLKNDPAASVGESSDNMIVHGDNLAALKALMPYYGGEVKLIYIDPPYNTGEEGWSYNDNVNSPEVRRWLAEVVGKEGDDLSRHDKWLSMMYPRLELLKSFLRPDGLICVSIDDNELGHLRLLMDEIFGTKNNLGTFVWKRRTPSAMGKKLISLDHEYVLVYGRDKAQTRLQGLEKKPEDYPYIETDDQGNKRRYASTDLTLGMTKEDRPGQFYPIMNPRTKTPYEGNPSRVWRFAPDTMAEVISNNLVLWPDEAPVPAVKGKKKTKVMERPRYKTYYDPENIKPKPYSTWIESSKTNPRVLEALEDENEVSILTAGMNTESSRLLEAILGSKAFNYPKPLSLVKSLVHMATQGDDLILDSFAGSGTTGHAVLALNAEDGGSRRFLLIEMEEDVIKNVTLPRMRKVISGYGAVPGLSGSFQACSLGEELTDAEGNINPEASFEDLARHLFFAETHRPLTGKPDGTSPLIGRIADTGYYLIRGPLTRTIFKALDANCEQHVVFADSRQVDPVRLQQHRVVFKMIPYDLRTK